MGNGGDNSNDRRRRYCDNNNINNNNKNNITLKNKDQHSINNNNDNLVKTKTNKTTSIIYYNPYTGWLANSYRDARRMTLGIIIPTTGHTNYHNYDGSSR